MKDSVFVEHWDVWAWVYGAPFVVGLGLLAHYPVATFFLWVSIIGSFLIIKFWEWVLG